MPMNIAAVSKKTPSSSYRGESFCCNLKHDDMQRLREAEGERKQDVSEIAIW